MKWQSLLWIIAICYFIEESHCYCNICKCVFIDDLINCANKNLSSLPKDEIYEEVCFFL